MKKGDPKVTSTQELRVIVESKLRIRDITVDSRKREVVFAKYVVIALSVKYTTDSYEKICGVLKYSNHSSVNHGLTEFHNLKGQKIFDLYEFIYHEICTEMDFRQQKHFSSRQKGNVSVFELEKDYRVKMWKMSQKNHSIRKRLQQENKQLKMVISKLQGHGNI